MIDLHTHSSHSDGSHTPEQLIDHAHAKKLTAIALTDHDCISGNPLAAKRASELGLLFIPGVELEITFSGGEFHLLGLDLRKPETGIACRIGLLQKNRLERNHKIIRRMNKEGIACTFEDVQKLAGGGLVSRLHFAKFLIQRKIVKTVKDAFGQYLSSGRPYYEAKEAMPLDEAIKLIHDAGGKAVIAHPFSLRMGFHNLCDYLLACKKPGMDGIEAWHFEYGISQCRRMEEFARANGFIVTAGSDFHGDNVKHRKIGYTAGETPIDEKYLAWYHAGL
ncbi:MAG: PHP domain-containing protein [Spirochaetaceae bacterium]|nr:MAG: PHP domain-containing protein [Spirochaetaceae bacterium]